MKSFAFVLALLLPLVAQAQDEISARQWLVNMASAVHQRNFDASFVVVKGSAMEPYHWLHGRIGDSELEHLSLLNGAGLEVVRVDDQVTYYEPQTQPYSLRSETIAGPIPEILFNDIDQLAKQYNFVLGGKGRIAGRAAQLVRIESLDEYKYNYWLWLDIESSLILKSAYVDHQGEVQEQLQLTHISVTERPAPQLVEIQQREFPKPLEIAADKAPQRQEADWHIGWVPKGFALLKSDRHKLDLNNELADYYLYSDGLVEISVFVQRPLPGKRRSGALSSGATTVYIHNGGSFDVSVVGNIPPLTAKAIAESVQRPEP